MKIAAMHLTMITLNVSTYSIVVVYQPNNFVTLTDLNGYFDQ